MSNNDMRIKMTSRDFELAWHLNPRLDQIHDQRQTYLLVKRVLVHEESIKSVSNLSKSVPRFYISPGRLSVLVDQVYEQIFADV